MAVKASTDSSGTLRGVERGGKSATPPKPLRRSRATRGPLPARPIEAAHGRALLARPTSTVETGGHGASPQAKGKGRTGGRSAPAGAPAGRGGPACPRPLPIGRFKEPSSRWARRGKIGTGAALGQVWPGRITWPGRGGDAFHPRRRASKNGGAGPVLLGQARGLPRKWGVSAGPRPPRGPFSPTGPAKISVGGGTFAGRRARPGLVHSGLPARPRRRGPGLLCRGKRSALRHGRLSDFRWAPPVDGRGFVGPTKADRTGPREPPAAWARAIRGPPRDHVGPDGRRGACGGKQPAVDAAGDRRGRRTPTGNTVPPRRLAPNPGLTCSTPRGRAARGAEGSGTSLRRYYGSNGPGP